MFLILAKMKIYKIIQFLIFFFKVYGKIWVIRKKMSKPIFVFICDGTPKCLCTYFIVIICLDMEIICLLI
jgi:hypothetical protein